VADKSTIASDEQAIQQARTAVASAQAALAQTTATIAASSAPPAATIAQDQAAVAQAQATVDTSEKALAETTLRSPVAGTVTAVNGSVGDTVGGAGSTGAQGAGAATGTSASTSTAPAGFITIESLEQLEVVAGLAEADAIKVAVGDPVTVTLPALPNVGVAGKVVAVSATSTVVSNVVTYATTISLVKPPAVVKDGMTASVAVIVQSRRNVLELPSAAITTTGPVSTVQLLQNGKSTATPVQIGLVGSTSTEIVGGLSEGDVVVIPTVTVSGAAATGTGAGAGAGVGGGGLGGGGFGGGFGGAAGGAGRTGG
jgi:multidrug efflux pump subunit AcrA (membrane-fusion protein)